MIYGGRIWGLLVLIADIWAIVHISQSVASTSRKVLWIVLPLIGFMLWFFVGPRSGRA